MTDLELIKAQETLGAEVLYVDGEWKMFHLTKQMWRLQDKWPLL